MSATDDLRVLVLIAGRSLLRHRGKTLLVGGMLAFGTFLLVLGTALLGSVERAMEKSVTGSLVGNLQVYAADAKDQLAFYGPAAGGQQDLGVIPDFPRTLEAISTIPHVVAVVPMGRDLASAVGGNELDELLGELREAVNAGDPRRVQPLVARVRQVAKLMADQYEKRLRVARDPAADRQALAIVERAGSDELWRSFEADPLAVLDFLDQKLAPLEADAQRIYLPYVGTDLGAFAKHFEGFEIVDGEMVPEGERGFLFAKEFYEQFAKNKVARELDLLEKARRVDGKRIADDGTLQAKAKRIRRLQRRVAYELDPVAAQEVAAALRAHLGREGGLAELLDAFLTVDDDNLLERRRLFYELIAPRIRLYKVNVGEELTVRAMSKSGYVTALSLKVYGTFRFRGLEDSMIASRYSLVDLMSFRDLYGLMTPEKRKELDAIRAEAGVREVSREDAEAALFGGDEALVAEAAPGGAEVPEKVEVERARPEAAFTAEDLVHGVVPNAAVVLDDPAATAEVRDEIRRRSQAQGLGIQVVEWRDAAGIVGQFILVLRAVLTIAIAIIFGVALVIINNSMIMATMDRVQEIGTMRAIGAQRDFVLRMFLLETLLLGAVAGALGAGGASLLLAVLGATGIPAPNEVFVFLFGGPALHPAVSATSLALGLLAVVLVSLGSTLYPARLATRIEPVVAMQRRE